MTRVMADTVTMGTAMGRVHMSPLCSANLMSCTGRTGRHPVHTTDRDGSFLVLIPRYTLWFPGVIMCVHTRAGGIRHALAQCIVRGMPRARREHARQTVPGLMHAPGRFIALGRVCARALRRPDRRAPGIMPERHLYAGRMPGQVIDSVRRPGLGTHQHSVLRSVAIRQGVAGHAAISASSDASDTDGYLDSVRIACSSPSTVTPYIRSCMMLRIIAMDCLYSQ